jgi:hypothetical protein
MSSQLTPIEKEAIAAALGAREALSKAIIAYETAGFGSHVTDPLRDALVQVDYSIREVTA